MGAQCMAECGEVIEDFLFIRWRQGQEIIAYLYFSLIQ